MLDTSANITAIILLPSKLTGIRWLHPLLPEPDFTQQKPVNFVPHSGHASGSGQNYNLISEFTGDTKT